MTEHRFASFAEFVTWEDQHEARHEYWDGRAVRLVSSPRACVLAANLLVALSGYRAMGCQVKPGGQRIAAGEQWLYVDGSVACGSEYRGKDLLNPRLLVQVLSSASEARDRGDKWLSHQRLLSLRDYILISQDAQRIEHFARDRRAWRYRAFEHGTIELASGGELVVAEVYQDAMRLPSDEDVRAALEARRGSVDVAEVPVTLGVRLPP